MTTAEGVFPKVGNDPIYASEINMFYGLGSPFAILPGSLASNKWGALAVETTVGSLYFRATDDDTSYLGFLSFNVFGVDDTRKYTRVSVRGYYVNPMYDYRYAAENFAAYSVVQPVVLRSGDEILIKGTMNANAPNGSFFIGSLALYTATISGAKVVFPGI